MKKTFTALKVRFYSFFVLFILALFSVVIITSIQQHESVVSIAVSIAGMPILERASTYIDGDKFENLAQTLDPDDPFYIETNLKFRELKEYMQVHFLYAMAICEDGHHRFILDGENPESELFSYLGEIEDVGEYDASYMLTYETGEPQYARIMYDYTGWGRLVSAYMPIFNSSGQVVGIIGVDFEGNDIYKAVMSSLMLLITFSIGITVIGVCLFFFLMRDLTNQNKNIEQRDNLLSTVNNAITLLLHAERNEFEGALRESMGMMAKTVDVDRVYIWKNHTIDGKLYCTQLYEWSEDAEPQQDTDITIDISYDENIPGWKEKFLRRECVNNIVRKMSPEEQNQLAPQGIVSILTFPVYIRDEFWGFVGFDDCRNERVFTANEESILRSGSLLIAYAFLRHDMTQMLETALQESTAASMAKSSFLSNMSHEMRTPMNAIIGMTAIGMKAEEINEKNAALGKIGEASSHLLGIINDILDMSKIEAGKMELTSVEFSIERMIHKVLVVIQFRVDEKEQNLKVNIDSRIPKIVTGDDQHLAQVVTNLLSNAVKFTPEKGEIRLDVSLLEGTENVCELRFEVSDNGIGIAPDKQDKLFDAFEQAEDVTNRVYGGTGLGLAISKRIVEMMNGTIWVESELGKGARFVFTVRLERCDDPDASADDSGDEDDVHFNEAAFKGAFKDKHLLVAEDVAINREILISLLGDSGLIIDCAKNGKEAVEMVSFAPDKYDIVFMDLQMPEMGGLEASRLIRTISTRKRKRLPIIAMTANVFKDDIDACFDAGMDDHLGKPLDIEKVFKKLSKYLKDDAG